MAQGRRGLLGGEAGRVGDARSRQHVDHGGQAVGRLHEPRRRRLIDHE